MILPEIRLRSYWQILLVLSAPIPLYICTLLGIGIPAFFLWIPIYIIAFIPYLLIILINSFLAFDDMLTYLLIMSQLVFAYLFAHSAIYGSMAKNDIGIFRTHKNEHKKQIYVRGVYIYFGLYILYILYFIFLEVMA